MRRFPKSFLLSNNECQVLKLTEELSDLLSVIDNRLEPRMKSDIADAHVLSARREWVLNAVSIAVVPKSFLRLWTGGASFKPYWLSRHLLGEESEQILRSYCDEENALLLDQALHLDSLIRDTLL